MAKRQRGTMPTDQATQLGRDFDEWIQDVQTMARHGYRPLLVVLRDDQGFELHSPALGPELATVISSLAEDIQPGPPVASSSIRNESPVPEDDDSVAAFGELLEARRTDGFLPCFLLFVDDTGGALPYPRRHRSQEAGRVHALAIVRGSRRSRAARFLTARPNRDAGNPRLVREEQDRELRDRLGLAAPGAPA
jgi:hypothetical protein